MMAFTVLGRDRCTHDAFFFFFVCVFTKHDVLTVLPLSFGFSVVVLFLMLIMDLLAKLCKSSIE